MKKTVTAICLVALLVLVVGILSACSGVTGGNTVQLYNGDSFYKEFTLNQGDSYDFGVPRKNGYSFLGWYSAKEGGEAYTDMQGKGKSWKSDNATKVYARWQPNNYVIFFDYNEATGDNTVASLAVTYDAPIAAPLPVPTKDGLAFAGWYTAPEKGTQVTDGNGMPVAAAQTLNDKVFTLSTEGIKLYARWSAKKITYTFVTEGTEAKSVTCTAGDVLHQLPTTLKDNYCFVGWCFDEGGSNLLKLPYTVPAESETEVTLYAKFEEGSFSSLRFTTISSTGDREYEVSYTGGSATRIVVPDSYYGKKVTCVRSISSATVEEIVLPQTVTQLGNNAFEGCTALKTVNIPTGVDTLPAKLFSGCTSLTEITIPQKVETIGKEAFSGCAAITSIAISAKVSSIGAGAFRNMASLTAFTVEEGNEKYQARDGVLYYQIGTSAYLVQYPAAKEGVSYEIYEATVKVMEYAFSSSRISTITLGGKLTTIEQGAFENCSKLINVTLSGSGATFNIKERAFASCSNLKAVKVELSRVPTLHATAFEGVSDAFSVYVNSGMIRNYQTATNWRNYSERIYSIGNIVGDFSYEEITGGCVIKQYFGTDKEVEIPETLNALRVLKIGEGAFSFSDVEKVTIGQYVNEICDKAFANCASLTKIVVKCDPPTLAANAFENINAGYGVYVQNNMNVLAAYRTAAGWCDIADKIWSAL